MKMNKITTIALLAVSSLMTLDTRVQAQGSRWNDGIFGQKQQWYTSAEARALADSVLQHQSTEGGWPRNVNMSQAPTAPAGDRANSFDNNATTQPMEFIALVASATGETKYKASFARGLEYMFAAQYPNGGFPQQFPHRVRRNREFLAYITYGDQVMINVLTVLRDVASGKTPYDFVSKELRDKAAVSLDRGIDCILKTQIQQDGQLTGWCAQHHPETLAPAQGRDFEPPTISGAESADVIRFLMDIENPSPQVMAAIEGAVAWYDRVAIKGMVWKEFMNAEGQKDKHIVPDPAGETLWARFYELETMRPIFTTHKFVIKYDFSEIPHDWRLNNYTMYGTWPASVLADYPAWKAKQTPTLDSKSPAELLLQYTPTDETQAKRYQSYVTQELGELVFGIEGTGTARTLTNTIVVAPNVTYDGKGEVLTADAKAMGADKGDQSEHQKPLFVLAPGAGIKNVTITAPGCEGIHMMGDNVLDNIHWEDVGEDAASVRSYFPGGKITIKNSKAFKAADKMFQFNRPCQVRIENFVGDDMGKLVKNMWQNEDVPFYVDLNNVKVTNVRNAVVQSSNPKFQVRHHDLSYTFAGRFRPERVFRNIPPENVTEY